MRRLMARRSADGLERSTYALAEASRNNPSARFFVDAADVPAKRTPPSLVSTLSSTSRRRAGSALCRLAAGTEAGRRGPCRDSRLGWPSETSQGDSWRGFDDPHITLRSHEYWEAALDRPDSTSSLPVRTAYGTPIHQLGRRPCATTADCAAGGDRDAPGTAGFRRARSSSRGCGSGSFCSAARSAGQFFAQQAWQVGERSGTTL